jgi:hypothetical protein
VVGSVQGRLDVDVPSLDRGALEQRQALGEVCRDLFSRRACSILCRS